MMAKAVTEKHGEYRDEKSRDPAEKTRSDEEGRRKIQRGARKGPAAEVKS